MRAMRWAVLSAFFAFCLSPLRAQDYAPLRANLHVHSNISNGLCDSVLCYDHGLAGPPSQVLKDAADAGLDVVGFSDHGGKISTLTTPNGYPECELPERYDEWDWLAKVKRTGGPASIRGFEWTGSQHVNIFGTNDYADVANWVGAGGVAEGMPNDFEHLGAWLVRHADDADGGLPVAQFNHVWWGEKGGSQFGGFSWPDLGHGSYDPTLDKIFALLEIGGNQLSHHFASDSEADWRMALNKGWHVAPTIGIDNELRLGFTAVQHHTGIWVDPAAMASDPSAAILEALRTRRVYATEANHTRLQFQITRDDIPGQHDWQWMGTRLDSWAGDKFLLRILVQNSSGDPLEALKAVQVKSPSDESGPLASFNSQTFPFTTDIPLNGSDLRSMIRTAQGEVCLYVDAQHVFGNAYSAPIWIKTHRQRFSELSAPDVTTSLGQTAQIRARLTNRVGNGVSGKALRFYMDGALIGNPAATDASGWATVDVTIPPAECAGDRDILVLLTGDAEYEDNNTSAKLIVGAPSSNVIYATPTGNDGNSGRCWAYSKRTIQAAVNACPPGGEVWVAAGTYPGNINIQGANRILGGFAGTETTATQRNPAKYPSVVDGNGQDYGFQCATGTTVDLSGMIVRNANYGVQGGVASVTNATFDHCYIAIQAQDSGKSSLSTPLTISGCTFQNNSIAFQVSAQGADLTVANNTFAGSNSVSFSGTFGLLALSGNRGSDGLRRFDMVGVTLTKDNSWGPQENIRPLSYGLTVASGATLTLGAGLTIQAYAFDSSNYASLYINGTLVSKGTAENPAILTSENDDTPYGGTEAGYSKQQWGGIVYPGGVNADLRGLTVRNASTALRAGTANLTDCVFDHNSLAVDSVKGGGVIRHSRFVGNGFAVRNESAVDIDARSNWWGDASGPYHATKNPNGRGNAVSDHVIFDDWLLTPNTTPFTMAQVARALRIAAGLAAASPADVTALNTVNGGASEGRVDVLDALRIVRKAAGVEANS